MGCCSSKTFATGEIDHSGLTIPPDSNNVYVMESEVAAFVNSLFDSKVAKSQLEWKEDYENLQVLEEVANRGNYVRDSQSAEKVGWFFEHFAKNEPGREIASTERVRNLIVNRCFSFAQNDASVCVLGHAIATIVCDNPEGQHLFSNSKTVAVIIGALNKYATTALSAGCLVLPIAIIANRSDRQHLVSTPEVVAAITNAFSIHAQSDHADNFVPAVCSVIRIVCSGNPEGRRLFTTRETACAIVKAFASETSTPTSLIDLGRSVTYITCDNSGRLLPDSQRLFSVRETAPTLFKCLNQRATTPSSAFWTAININNIVADNAEAKLWITTPETVASFVDCFRRFPESNRPYSMILRAIGHICWDNRAGQQMFTHQEIASAIYHFLEKLVAHESQLENVSRAIAFISVDNPAGQQLFSTPEVVGWLVEHAKKFAITPSCIRFVCKAISSLVCNNEIGKNLLAVPEMIEAVKKMEEHANDEESKKEHEICLKALCASLDSIVAEPE